MALRKRPARWGEEFGLERVKDFLVQNAERAPQEFCDDALVAKIAAWCGNSDKEQDDDLTLIVVDYQAA
jgi:hypothetical protein